jgi:hypothetical protein|tara:strand:+ start:2397 stop:2627 length:231 start_codon:yes stop_codon:yes gene_type:complete
MTQYEFDTMGHNATMWVMYQGQRKYVIALSFTERLFALVDSKDSYPADVWQWVRCENVELIKCKTLQFPTQNKLNK